MHEIRRYIHGLIDDVDALRPIVLSGEHEKDLELRRLLRRMLYQLDNMQRQHFISVSRYQKIVSLLASLLDAEHGTLIKGSVEEPLGSDESEKLELYIEERKDSLKAAQQDMPAVYHLILDCSDLLGREPASDPDISAKCRKLEMHLREHLQDDASLRRELNQLTSAFENSLNFLTDILKEVGGDAPEIVHAKEILKQELPADPKKAHELLQHARQSLVQAGDKISSATHTLKQSMQQQMQQVQSLSRRLEDAEKQAKSDPLTGLGNRRKLAEFLTATDRSVCSVIALDIDHFKAINDSYGHDVGDEILTLLAELLTGSVRESDMVARLGGEEFCIILPAIEADQAYHIAEKIRQAVEIHPFSTSQTTIAVTISLGVAGHKEGESNAAWLKRADQALYQSKSSGRNMVTMVQ